MMTKPKLKLGFTDYYKTLDDFFVSVLSQAFDVELLCILFVPRSYVRDQGERQRFAPHNGSIWPVRGVDTRCDRVDLALAFA